MESRKHHHLSGMEVAICQEEQPGELAHGNQMKRQRSRWLSSRSSRLLCLLVPTVLFPPGRPFQPTVRSYRDWNRGHLGVTARDDFSNDGYCGKLLKEFGFDVRRRDIKSSDLPLLCEVHTDGQWRLARLIGFVPPTKAGGAPKMDVEHVAFPQKHVQRLDLGMITSVWDGSYSRLNPRFEYCIQKNIERLPLHSVERALQNMYDSVRNKPRSRRLTKKKISQLVAQAPLEERARTEEVIRKVSKAGEGMVCLVDSSTVMKLLFETEAKGEARTSRRGACGSLVSEDSVLGGRFKRMPCIHLSFQLDQKGEVEMVSFINGGWLAVDSSVRATTEGRKFADRASASSSFNPTILTVADERIVHRLECLAMGEVFGSSSREEHGLEVDARDALKGMDLPVTPDGAGQALVKSGRWASNKTGRVEPWSNTVLDASSRYAQLDISRKRTLSEAVSSSAKEGRLDLTKLPSVCVDAARTSFRDDAMSLRPRSKTGRAVVEGASKWEILIHIADVSDVFSPEPMYLPENTTTILSEIRQAAKSRGTSRYDLPLGPLHLMPPRALQALSMDTVKPAHEKQAKDGVNRCVTLWAYIDERDGRILDSGLERTLISKPVGLSFAEANTMLQSVETSQSGIMLVVMERILSKWKSHHLQTSGPARDREQRLAVRKMVADELNTSDRSDDGRGGFRRTLSHRLVDAAIDLHGHALSCLLQKTKSPLPVAAGAGRRQGGRFGSGPLRRYVDCLVQRQALSVLCGYGGPPMKQKECQDAQRDINEARDKQANLRPTKTRLQPQGTKTQIVALRSLQKELFGRNRSNDRPIRAISTGRQNQVTIVGNGAIAKCGGVKGNLKGGTEVSVLVKEMEVEKGHLFVELAP